MERPLSGLVAGAAAGLAATLLMSAVMLLARRLGLTPTLPPEEIAERAIEAAADREATDDEERAVASVAHLGFGAGAGALFGMVAGGLRSLSAGGAAAIGAAYAAGIWLVSYAGWVPMLRILPPASRDDPGRVGTMVVAHGVYGVALGALTRLLQRRFSGG